MAQARGDQVILVAAVLLPLNPPLPRSLWSLTLIMAAEEPSSILLTGATGYVGAATIRAFIALGKIDKVTCMVRDAKRAQEVVEIGARRLIVVPDIMDLPKVVSGGSYDCVLNTVGAGPSQPSSAATGVKYAEELRLAEETLAAMRLANKKGPTKNSEVGGGGKGGAAVVFLSGTGCVGAAHARDGAKPGDYTEWSELKPYNPKRHAMEKAIYSVRAPLALCHYYLIKLFVTRLG